MSDKKEISVQNLFKNSKFLLFGNLIGKLSTLVLVPIYSWMILPSDFGIIFTIQTIASFLMVVVPFSVEVGISRLFFNQPTKRDVELMFSSGVICLFFLSGFVYFILLVFSEFFSRYLELPKTSYLIIGIVYCFLGAFFPVGSALLLAGGNVKSVSFSVIGSNIILVLANVLFVLNLEDKVLGYLLSYLVFHFFQFILFWIITKDYFILKVDGAKIKELYSYSIQFLMTNVSGWVVALSDRLMLLKMVGSNAVGLYSAGYTIAAAPNVIVNSINQAFVPYSYSIFSELKKDRLKELSDIMMVLFIGYTSLFLGIIFFADNIIQILGPDYRDSEYVIKIVVFAYYFNALKLIVHNPMSFDTRMVKYKSLIWFFTAIVNVLLNFVLIPAYSFNGAALATFLSFFISLFPVYFISQKTIFIEVNFKIIISVSIIFGALLLFNFYGCFQALWMKIALFIAINVLLISRVRFLKKVFSDYLRLYFNGIFNF